MDESVRYQINARLEYIHNRWLSLTHEVEAPGYHAPNYMRWASKRLAELSAEANTLRWVLSLE